MTLSVIIVSYNVKYFLENCLFSVQRALEQIDGEVIVIDNLSTDNSLFYLKPKFPDVKFVQNHKNVGFGKACNQGLSMATGKYILFLNPDTIVPEDCFSKCITYFETYEKTGAIGVTMVDGSGHFLKESKRSFPDPLTSFYKLSGLTALFPHSKTFSRYHLGHLSENKNHVVDVLCGAFMMIRKNILDALGGFDEQFFMYGEDIDLSYRIQKAGYNNVYLAETRIIHFKGESAVGKKLQYIRMFYQAMGVFVNKHYGGSRKKIFAFFIHLAIWLRALLTLLGNTIKRFGLPLFDALLMVGSFWLVKFLWNNAVKSQVVYNPELLWPSFTGITLIYCFTAWFMGLYDKTPGNGRKVFRASAIALLTVLVIYSLLPEAYRFSRAIIVLGSLTGFLLVSLFHRLLQSSEVLPEVATSHNRAGVIVGTPEEYRTALHILQSYHEEKNIIGRISVNADNNGSLGTIHALPALQRQLGFTEVVFCLGVLPCHHAIGMIEKTGKNVHYKFLAPQSRSIIGSHFKAGFGEVHNVDQQFHLYDPYYRRVKRLFDVAAALIMLLVFPLHFLMAKNGVLIIKRSLVVLFGKKTWIGYNDQLHHLPKIRPAILGINGQLAEQQPQNEFTPGDLNYWYAKNYTFITDLRLLCRNYKKLGMGVF